MSSLHGDDSFDSGTPTCRITDEPLVEPLLQVFVSDGNSSSSAMIRVSIPDVPFRQPIDLCCVVDVSGSTGEGQSTIWLYLTQYFKHQSKSNLSASITPFTHGSSQMQLFKTAAPEFAQATDCAFLIS